jgi:ribosomal protein S18 acetylase RimI-like enzyme
MPLPTLGSKKYIFYLGGREIGSFCLNESGWPDVVMSNKKTAYITNFGIIVKYRGKGYGKRMIRFALDKVKNEGYTHASLWVHKDNIVAIKTYLGAEFRKYRSSFRSSAIRMHREI